MVSAEPFVLHQKPKLESPSWSFHEEPSQCQPEGWSIVGENDSCRLDVKVKIEKRRRGRF